MSDASKPISLDEYRASFAGRSTVLQQVRAHADATLDAAMVALHRPEQDLGPTMISLPSDNRKFIVERDGTLRWDDRPEVFDCIDHPPNEELRCAATVRFGDAREPANERELVDPNRLELELRRTVGDLHYRMRTFVAMPSDAGVVLLSVTNDGMKAAAASFDLRFVHPAGVSVTVAHNGRSARIEAEGRLLAWVTNGAGRDDADQGSIDVVANGCVVRSRVGAALTSQTHLVLPRTETFPDDATIERLATQLSVPPDFDMAHIELPDATLDRIFHASIAHCFAAARRSRASRTIAPWIASMAYGPLESEAQSVIRGMQVLGAQSFAAQAHRYFADKIDADGRLTTGYTLLGTGWHLWTFGEYDQLFEDDVELRANAPSLARACRWIMAQRKKSIRVDNAGRRAPESGLMPPGPLADWDAFAFYFYANANYCAGLRDAAKALARIGDPNAAAIAADALDYQRDLLTAYRFARARAPVVPLRDGRWVPFSPTQIQSHGAIDELHPDEDAGRSWCYDIEAGASHLIALGLLDPHSSDADAMVEHLEDVQFLRDGWFAYPAVENAKDPFQFGGFAKVQPYYARTVETHALRDDVEPFLRSYFNSIATLLNREDLSLWEHFAAHGAWNKTHETGYFLFQTRTMLLTERGDELWLAPFIPRTWLADGRHLSVENAPTRFGRATYRIDSHVAFRWIDVTIDPPHRRPPTAVVLRLRHPDATPIRKVTVNGADEKTFDAAAGTIRLEPPADPNLRGATLVIRVAY